MAHAPPISHQLRLGLLNLQDAFLNASVQYRQMMKAPLEVRDDSYLYTDRGRLERSWVAYLYVLVEAWGASKMRDVNAYVCSVVNTDRLINLLRQGRKDGSIKKMHSVRHYMFHRDQREYWDDGRLAAIGNLAYHLELHSEFDKVILLALQSSRPQ